MARVQVMEQCKGKKLHNAECGPHIYCTAERAYVTMKKKKHNQCIVVSGESGAGKTEANRQLMNYLIWRGGAARPRTVVAHTQSHSCPHPSEGPLSAPTERGLGAVAEPRASSASSPAGSSGKSGTGLSDRIIGTNPILEAFGNAKTTRNNNSSRFGRMVLVEFNATFDVVGAEIRTFLLERSRVVSTANQGERAYHIMYHICVAGAGGCPLKVEDCHYLSLSGTTKIDGARDVARDARVDRTRGRSDADDGRRWDD